MLQYLNQCSRGRGAWLLMALTAFILELVALWFQHVMLLQPCVMCIYERCALFGIMGAGLVGAIGPQNAAALCRHGKSGCTARYADYSWRGSIRCSSCTLHRSRPAISPRVSRRGCRWINGCRRFFVASGDCSVRQWQFLSLEMPQWLVGIFAAYLLVAILVIVAQPFKAKKRDLFGSLSRGKSSPQ